MNSQDWDSERDGGELKLLLRGNEDNTIINIEPYGGRLVLFLSGVINHEVCGGNRDRVAITSWMR